MHRPAPAASSPARSLVPRVLVAGALMMLLVGVLGAGFILWRLGGDASVSRAVIAQLDSAARKSGLPADSDVVTAIKALADAS